MEIKEVRWASSTGLIWPRTWTSASLLGTEECGFVLHKMLEID